MNNYIVDPARNVLDCVIEEGAKNNAKKQQKCVIGC